MWLHFSLFFELSTHLPYIHTILISKYTTFFLLYITSHCPGNLKKYPFTKFNMQQYTEWPSATERELCTEGQETIMELNSRNELFSSSVFSACTRYRSSYPLYACIYMKKTVNQHLELNPSLEPTTTSVASTQKPQVRFPMLVGIFLKI